MVAPSPPAPLPQDVPHPSPRTVWAGERYRIQALDWSDSSPPTYSVLARHGRHWEPATGEETWCCLVALITWLDAARTPTHES